MSEGAPSQDFAWRMTTAIKMADAAEAILERVRMAVNDPKYQTMPNSIGIDPMLLALAMELLLKAWITWDGKVSSKKLMIHELAVLFSYLQPHQRENIENAFAQANPWFAPNWFEPHGRDVASILDRHNKAFVDWRYVHEFKEPMSFSISDIEAVLIVTLELFRSRYTEVRVEREI